METERFQEACGLSGVRKRCIPVSMSMRNVHTTVAMINGPKKARFSIEPLLLNVLSTPIIIVSKKVYTCQPLKNQVPTGKLNSPWDMCVICVAHKLAWLLLNRKIGPGTLQTTLQTFVVCQYNAHTNPTLMDDYLEEER
jgi:hypothetical protein